MQTEEFNKVVDNRIEKIKSVLVKKAEEYSSQDDRLHNFKVASLMVSKPETPEQALWGMARKHLVSIADLIDKTSLGERPSDYMRNEKIGDAINYLILLEALFIERPEKKTIKTGINAELVYSEKGNLG